MPDHRSCLPVSDAQKQFIEAALTDFASKNNLDVTCTTPSRTPLWTVYDPSRPRSLSRVFVAVFEEEKGPVLFFVPERLQDGQWTDGGKTEGMLLRDIDLPQWLMPGLNKPLADPIRDQLRRGYQRQTLHWFHERLGRAWNHAAAQASENRRESPLPPPGPN